MNSERPRDSASNEFPRAEDESLVGPFLDGELPQGEARRVEALIDESPELRALAEQYRTLDDLARQSMSAPPHVSPSEWGAVWENIRSEAGPSPRSTQRLSDWIIPFISIAALILLGLYLGQLILGTSPDPAPSEPRTAQGSPSEIDEIEPIEDEEFNAVDFSEL